MSDPDSPSVGDLASRLYAAYLAGIPVPERPTSLDEVKDLLDLHLHTGLLKNEQASVGVTPRPGSEREGLVLTIVVDDMPQLVRSVLGAVADVGAHPARLLHAVIQVHRDASGRLLDAEPAVLGQRKGRRESWICVTVTDATDADELLRRVRQALAEAADVRRDTEAMSDQLRMAVDNLRHVHPEQDGAAFLEWMAAGNASVLTTVAHPSADPAAERHVLGVARLASDPDPRPAHEPVGGVIIRHVPADLTWAQQHPLLEFGVRLSDDRLIRFICFLTRGGRTANVATTPILRGVSQAVLAELQAPAGSYTAGELLGGVLDRLPRTILLTLPIDDVIEMVRDTVTVSIRPRVHTRLFRTADRRTAIVLVLLPRDRYSAGSAPQIVAAVVAATGRPGLVAADHRSEAPTATVTVTLPVPADWDLVAAETAIRTSVDEIFRTWADQLARRLPENHATVSGGVPFDFDASYQLDRSIDDAVRDLMAIETLSDEHPIEVVVRRLDTSTASATFDLFSRRDLTLSDILPVIHNLGVRVVDERAYRVAGRNGRPGRLYSLGIELPNRKVPDSLAERFTAAFLALWSGKAEQDGFNALITHSELTWSDVAVLRAYSRYARQLGGLYGPVSLARIVLDHPGVAADLVALFGARFDPSLSQTEREKGTEAAETAITLKLDQILSLDTDRGLRLLMNLILATERTSAFTGSALGADWHPLAFKITPSRLLEVPQPVPDREIWVYDPTFEGVHLRFGPIARGGLRWSDRPADFRTEILGLVKAQEVKNAVIIPVGAKGGFVLAAPPPTGDTAADRTALQAAGRNAYRAFIGALLDLTDNRPDDTVVAPADVVRHDSDDPYLVVAADKGTATFSDLANEVAEERGFWLGDAFASGGSAGYDHKAMGITARGAWESVRYHFAEIGVDVQTDDISCVGIGDMSGDVFGNGMLRSPHLRLMAAFDHRHIFVDPDPNTAAAALERGRLFDLPGSTWASYEKSLISAGGGVWARTSKAIPVSAQMRTALGLGDTVTVMTPPELIRAVLTAPVDLLWNGGVGTYVKASTESHVDASDKANDQVRVDAAQLRVRVVGEGGNLGFTQRARVEFAQKGGRIRTDAIDNSAGVDTSDHEVNIKIAVRHAIATGEIAGADRSVFLAGLTDDIAEAVLADNVAQNRVLAVAELAAPHQVEVYARLLDRLEARGRVRRQLDTLPSTAELRSRSSRGLPLTSPELSVVLAHVKSDLTEELAGLDIWDSPPIRRAVEHYFPPALRTASPDSIRRHPLAPQIAATVIANQIVNHGGLTYVDRLCEETGCTAGDAARAFLAVSDIFDMPGVWDRVWNPSAPMPTRARHELILASRRLLDRASRWMLLNRQRPLDLTQDPAHYRPRVAELLPGLGRLIRPSSKQLVKREVDRLVDLGAPHAQAEELSQLLYAYTFLDIVDIASTVNRSVTQVADVYFGLGERLRVDTMLAAVAELPRRDRWEALARRSLRDNVFATLRAATNDLFTLNQDFHGTEPSIRRWAESRATRLAAVDAIRDEILTGDSTVELAALSVLTAKFAAIPT